MEEDPYSKTTYQGTSRQVEEDIEEVFDYGKEYGGRDDYGLEDYYAEIDNLEKTRDSGAPSK